MLVSIILRTELPQVCLIRIYKVADFLIGRIRGKQSHDIN